MTPGISVLIGSYNNGVTLPRAMTSILSQSEANLELVVVDDGSRDTTPEVVAAIAAQDPRVRLLSLDKNVGIARSLNQAIQTARAPFVAIQDADDYSEPNRLARQLSVLRSRSDVAVVGCRMREVDSLGRILTPRTSFADGDVRRILMRFNPIPNGSAAFRRDAVLMIGGYDPRYRFAAEYDLWLRLAERYRIVALDEVLANRVMSGMNVAARAERAQTTEALLIRMRALWRRRTLRGATGLFSPLLSTITPLPLKRARRRWLGQAL